MKTALLLTESFPLGGLTEEAFVRPGIEALSEKFDRVIVVPVTDRGPLAASLPLNMIVARDIVDAPDRQRKWLRPLLHPLAALCSRGDIRYSLSAAMVERAVKAVVDRFGLTPADTVMEAFWFDFPSSVLAALHRRHGFRYVIRAHGYDIYSDRAYRARREAIDASDGLYVVSDAGADYLRQKFTSLASKISTAYLGVDAGVAESRHSAPGDKAVRLLTVAQLIPRKRCDLCFRFANALATARPDWLIEWTLIGDGPEAEAIKAEVASAKRPNLTVNMTGALSHDDVMAYYKSHIVDWLMLLSSEEGFGLVLAEALAHGVPVIATDVGGISESVDDSTGLLLALDPEPEEFVRGIIPYIDSRVRYEALCQGARSLVAEKFDSAVLRRRWADMLRSLLP